MVSKLEPAEIEEIISRWVNGENERKISADIGRGVGTANKYIQDARRKHPDLAALRELKMSIDAGHVPFIDLLRTAKMLIALEEAGLHLGTESLSRIEALLKDYGNRIDEAVKAGLRIQDLERAQGKSFEDLTQDADQLQERVRTLLRSKEEAEKDIIRREQRLGSIGDYEKLKEGLDGLGLFPLQAKGFLGFHKRLMDLGFSESAASAFAEELKKHGSVPSQAAEDLARALSKYNSLEDAVATLEEKKKELDRTRSRLKAAMEEIRGLQATIESKRSTIRDMNGQLERLRMDLKTSQGELRRAQASKADLEKALDDIDARIQRVSQLAVIASLFKESGTSYPKDSVFEVSRALLMGIEDFVGMHSDEIVDAAGLKKVLRTTVEKMGGRIA